MSATTRGAIIFGILLIVLVLCSVLTFSVLPNSSVAVGLPVITVPGEAYNGALPSAEAYGVGNAFGGWTNTFVATLIADLAVLIFVVLAWRASKGWTREVPTRFQSWVEMVGDFIYGQTKSFAGVKPLAKKWLFPLAASIFVFLLAVNWMKLFPGVESVGFMHCAHEGTSGYPSLQVGDNAYQLYIERALYAGVRASHEDYEACEHFVEDAAHHPTHETLVAASGELREAEAALLTELDADTTLTQEERDARIDEKRLEVTESVYPEATFALTADQLEKGVVPYVQVVTPFVRGGSTDLNLTIGLALVTFVAIQVFGVAAQGPAYFMKFINLNALGTMHKKPLGAVDFLVGLFEIISEIGKIISLAFRLFGNLFAGGILLAVMSFLIAALLPVIFYGLEVIVTTIQAFVFAVLTIVFSAQAMEGHHGDEEHEEGAEAHAH
ncbi:MAG: F0F1 ATP synthase subunit A [Anaerolineae bacterium]|nr:F0F1 ATP synthase subunit A [Anaerolineae bacterium]